MNEEVKQQVKKDIFGDKNKMEETIRKAAELSAKDQQETIKKYNKMMKEKLFEAIRETCPELKELSFGCRIRVYTQGTEYGGNESNPEHWHNIDDEAVMNYDDHLEYDSDEYDLEDLNKGHTGDGDYEEDMFFEIIGHPIQLSHLLRTCAARGKEMSISYDGSILEYNYGDGQYWQDTNIQLELSKPFDEQEEEVYNKLAEIIYN